MLFNSFHFYIFFPIAAIVYYLLPYKYRWAWLLAASCYFYMAFIPVYILILAITIIVDYYAARIIEQSSGRKRRIFLIVSVISNIGFLAVFKYYNFAALNIEALASLLHWNYALPLLKIALPVGLSFHTFQALSYVIEVYRGKQKAEKHFGIYALYVMFFPQLVAGPIERPQNLIHQFKEEHLFSESGVVSGLKLMARGFFKKIVIADNAALAVNLIFGNLEAYHGVPLIIGAIFFSIQLFCDFSGYSDIARGSARVLGFNLMINFNKPYLATSLADYWQRWHISLSTWFRDYLFSPLLAARRSLSRSWLYIVTIATFLVSGLWHGASWTFIVWGIMHGFILSLSLATRQLRTRLIAVLGFDRFPRFLRVLRIGMTMTIVTLLLVVFRAENFEDVGYFFTHIFNGLGHQIFDLSAIKTASFGIYFGGLILVFVSICVYWLFSKIEISLSKRVVSYNFATWGIWYFFILWLLYFGAFSHQSFIYFQF